MSLIEQARKDVLQITTNTGEFGVPIAFISPSGLEVQAIGTASKHHLSINGDGVAVNSKNASCSISEYALNALDYPIRNANNEVDLRGHKVRWKDSTGLEITYIIDEWFPDETLGLIVCILGDFKS